MSCCFISVRHYRHPSVCVLTGFQYISIFDIHLYPFIQSSVITAGSGKRRPQTNIV